MIREDLVAERIAIKTYREIIKYFGGNDPTSPTMMEDILSKEEEHADELSNLLFAVEPNGASKTRNLYFKDEVQEGSQTGKGSGE